MLDWVKSYQKSYFTNDLFAGLTVGIMLIPQGMAYAIIAGLPPEYGLYAATVPILVYAILGTSRHLAVGPVAMDSLLVAQFVGSMKVAGPEHYIELALLFAFLTGVFQMLLGFARMGFLVNFLSKPVISGFTSAAAIIIGFSQLKHLFGIDIEKSNKIQELLVSFGGKVMETNPITLAIGIGAIVTLVLIKKKIPKLPGALIVVSIGTMLVYFMRWDQQSVKIVGDIPQGFPEFKMHSIDFELFGQLWEMALTIALVAFMEAISVAKAIQAKNPYYEVKPNRELIAIGAANFIGSFFQSYPVTGGFSRTAVNEQAGARTPLASIISVALIVLTLLFLTPLFYYLPKAVLASIIMVAVYGLMDFKYAIELWKFRKIEFLMLLTTFVVTLTVGITIGIGVGVALSILVMVYVSSRPHVAELGRIEGTNQFRNVSRFGGLEEKPDVLILRFDAQLYFANASYLKEQVEAHAAKKGDALKLIILNMESVGVVDSSALIALEDLINDFDKKGVAFYFSGTIGPVRDVFHKSGFINRVGEHRFFLDIQFALEKYEQIERNLESGIHKMALQTNETTDYHESDENH